MQPPSVTAAIKNASARIAITCPLFASPGLDSTSDSTKTTYPNARAEASRQRAPISTSLPSVAGMSHLRLTSGIPGLRRPVRGQYARHRLNDGLPLSVSLLFGEI